MVNFLLGRPLISDQFHERVKEVAVLHKEQQGFLILKHQKNVVREMARQDASALSAQGSPAASALTPSSSRGSEIQSCLESFFFF